MTTLVRVLRRYTDIPALVYLLTNKAITLLDPASWDDTNDSHFIKLYQEKKRFQSVLALCFTQNSETYHHWRVFANGSSGVCIEFEREQLLRSVRKQRGVRTGQVRYLKLDEIKNLKPSAKNLPFLKRYPFEQENEFRMILESHEVLKSLDISLPLSCIRRITLSPWLHPSLSAQIKKTIWRIEGCRLLDLARSTLISNEDWKAFGESAVSRATKKRRSR